MEPGLLPFGLIFTALVLTGMYFVFSKLTAEIVTEVLIAMGTIWLVVMLVLVFVTHICMKITPVEHFTDTSVFMADFTKAETTVCSMMGDLLQFIKNDAGKKGVDNPAIPTATLQLLIDGAGGPVTTCPSPTDSLLTSDIIDDRLSRMERTLERVIEPYFKSTYDKSMSCEGFDSPLPSDRLKKVEALIRQLTVKYLTPIQKKQADLQKGIASDCDKKRGSKAAVS